MPRTLRFRTRRAEIHQRIHRQSEGSSNLAHALTGHPGLLCYSHGLEIYQKQNQFDRARGEGTPSRDPQELVPGPRVARRRHCRGPEESRSGVIKPTTLVEADEILTPQEAETVVKGEAELRRGEYVTLAQLHHDLDRPAIQKRRKTA